MGNKLTNECGSRLRSLHVHSDQGMLVGTTAKPLTAVASHAEHKVKQSHYHSSNFRGSEGDWQIQKFKHPGKALCWNHN